jgi:hypothetical protein
VIADIDAIMGIAPQSLAIARADHASERRKVATKIIDAGKPRAADEEAQGGRLLRPLLSEDLLDAPAKADQLRKQVLGEAGRSLRPHVAPERLRLRLEVELDFIPFRYTLHDGVDTRDAHVGHREIGIGRAREGDRCGPVRPQIHGL